MTGDQLLDVTLDNHQVCVYIPELACKNVLIEWRIKQYWGNAFSVIYTATKCSKRGWVSLPYYDYVLSKGQCVFTFVIWNDGKAFHTSTHVTYPEHIAYWELLLEKPAINNGYLDAQGECACHD